MLTVLLSDDYIIAAVATLNALFGQGTGAIALNNVQCTGTEARLADCPVGTTTTCSHSDDAGVRCRAQTGTVPQLQASWS